LYLGLASVITITNERRSGVTYPPAWGANPGLGFCEIVATGITNSNRTKDEKKIS
jgi:hypothetical protein